MKYSRVHLHKKPEIIYPKGFDISFTEFVDTYPLTPDIIDKIQQLMKDKNIAWASIGYETFFRKGQLDALLKEVSNDKNNI